MQIKQAAANRALVFYMVDATDHVTGKTGLGLTVRLSKNGGTFAAPAGTILELGFGFYFVTPNATDTDTLGVLALTATATGADRCAMAYEVVANLESDSIAALAAIQAKTDNLPAAPAAVGDIPTIPDILGAAGGLTVETVAKLQAADQILLTAPYVPDESPVLILPAAGAAAICHVYGYFREQDGSMPADGTPVIFTLPSGKRVAGDETILNRKTIAIIKRKLIGEATFAVLTWADDEGTEHNYVPLIRTDQITPAAAYQVTGAGLQNAPMTLTEATFDFKTLSQS